MRLPKHIKANVDAAERMGHKLVSQGCAMFRCTGCDAKGYMDIPHQMMQECPAARKCPHCSRPKEAFNVTCLRSECQEKNYNENRDRMRRKRS